MTVEIRTQLFQQLPLLSATSIQALTTNALTVLNLSLATAKAVEISPVTLTVLGHVSNGYIVRH